MAACGAPLEFPPTGEPVSLCEDCGNLVRHVGRYKRRIPPEEFEAICYRGEQDKQLVRSFVTAAIDEVGLDGRFPPGLSIQTPTGRWEHVYPGDYILEGVHGYYVYQPQFFRDIYERVK